MIKHLSKYLPRQTLNELYKLYVIPATNCDYSESLKLNQIMEKLESVQYSAALAVTGAWKGTSREKLEYTPEYTRQPI